MPGVDPIQSELNPSETPVEEQGTGDDRNQAASGMAISNRVCLKKLCMKRWPSMPDPVTAAEGRRW